MADNVQKIKDKLDIVEVISPYVELHKAGKHYKGKSPFTNEKTPSFYVSPDRGMYYCFSSNQGGDMFTFIEKMEGVDFKGALRILAEKAGVELIREDPKKRDARDTQYLLLETATAYFFKEREKYPQIDEYLKSRGVKGKTIHVWRIGYAPDEWRALKKHLEEKEFKETDMLRAGLIKKSDTAKESYDVFRDRIIFPIFDASGRTVAFSGRIFKKDNDAPKYVNSPETELYIKSNILFGYDKARQGIRKLDFSLVVEGQFDLVLAHQAGYTNTVAVSGTALTPSHIALLQRLSNRSVLALDSDRAGIEAAKKASAIMLSRGMDVKVCAMPEGKDPADIIKEDMKKFRTMIGEALHVVDFLLGYLKHETKDGRAFKLRVREEVLPLLALIPSHIDREHFEEVVAHTLKTTKDAIHYEIERLMSSKGREMNEQGAYSEPSAITTNENKNPKGEYLLYFATVLEVLETEEEKKHLCENLKKLLTRLIKAYEKKPKESFSYSPEEINEYIAKISKHTKKNFEEDLRANDVKTIARDVLHNLTVLRKVLINEVIKEKQRELEKKETRGELYDDLITIIHDLQKEREKQVYFEEDLLLKLGTHTKEEKL